MKKVLLVLLALATVNLPSLAVITPEQSTSQDYIQNHGHSDEVSRLIDLQKASINGTKSDYKSKDPDWYSSSKKVSNLRKFFMYIDPALEDDRFGHSDIMYTNRWNEF